MPPPDIFSALTLPMQAAALFNFKTPFSVA